MAMPAKRGFLRPNGHSSRAPMFVVIGLLFVCFLLVYNYMSVNARSRQLMDQLDIVKAKMRDCDLRSRELSSKNEALSAKNRELMTSVQNAETKEKAAEENLNSMQNTQLKGADSMKLLREQMAKTQEELDTLKTERDDCMRNQTILLGDVENLKQKLKEAEENLLKSPVDPLQRKFPEQQKQPGYNLGPRGQNQMNFLQPTPPRIQIQPGNVNAKNYFGKRGERFDASGNRNLDTQKLDRNGNAFPQKNDNLAGVNQRFAFTQKSFGIEEKKDWIGGQRNEGMKIPQRYGKVEDPSMRKTTTVKSGEEKKNVLETQIGQNKTAFGGGVQESNLKDFGKKEPGFTGKPEVAKKKYPWLKGVVTEPLKQEKDEVKGSEEGAMGKKDDKEGSEKNPQKVPEDPNAPRPVIGKVVGENFPEPQKNVPEAGNKDVVVGKEESVNREQIPAPNEDLNRGKGQKKDLEGKIGGDSSFLQDKAKAQQNLAGNQQDVKSEGKEKSEKQLGDGNKVNDEKEKVPEEVDDVTKATF